MIHSVLMSWVQRRSLDAEGISGIYADKVATILKEYLQIPFFFFFFIYILKNRVNHIYKLHNLSYSLYKVEGVSHLTKQIEPHLFILFCR